MAQTGIRPAPGYGTQPEKTAIVVPGMDVPQATAPRGVPRILVILIVALILSGGGIMAYVFLLAP